MKNQWTETIDKLKQEVKECKELLKLHTERELAFQAQGVQQRERIAELETEKKELIKEIKNQISKCTEKMKTELDTNFIDGAIVGYEHVLRMIREGGKTE